jgi:hypothetical protein
VVLTAFTCFFTCVCREEAQVHRSRAGSRDTAAIGAAPAVVAEV